MTTAERTPVVLEPLRWWDIAEVTRMEAELFAGDSPWTAEMFWSELAAGHHYVVHRDHQGQVDGYAGVATGRDDAGVQTIGVRPDNQHRGIGRALLADLLQVAGDRRVLLEVRTDNEPAIGLYRSVGFTRVALRRRYYQPSGADAYTMQRPAAAHRDHPETTTTEERRR